jgi:septal ring factor EnvC (AmiA/AmiB activator)
VWKKIKPYLIEAIVLIFLYTGIVLWVTKGSGDRLNAELKASKWSMESVSRLNTELATGLRSVSGELAKSDKLIADQQSTINGQQSIINKQKSIIDGIIAQINGAGNDIRAKIKSIAEIGRLLYNFYNQSPN